MDMYINIPLSSTDIHAPSLSLTRFRLVTRKEAWEIPSDTGGRMVLLRTTLDRYLLLLDCYLLLLFCSLLSFLLVKSRRWLAKKQDQSNPVSEICRGIANAICRFFHKVNVGVNFNWNKTQVHVPGAYEVCVMWPILI